MYKLVMWHMVKATMMVLCTYILSTPVPWQANQNCIMVAAMATSRHKSEIPRILAWQRLGVAAMAGAPVFFRSLPYLSLA